MRIASGKPVKARSWKPPTWFMWLRYANFVCTVRIPVGDAVIRTGTEQI